LAQTEGLVGAVVVDLRRGTVQDIAGRGSRGSLELEALAEGRVLESVRAVVANACPGEALHSVILTLGHHHHVILPSRRSADRYLYLVLDRDEATFGLLLHRLSEADAL
jgi:hypothetical protein